MDEIKETIKGLIDASVFDSFYYQKVLLEAIEEYGEDQWARGHEVGKEDGYESAVYHECS